jgi:hypothetical protein
MANGGDDKPLRSPTKPAAVQVAFHRLALGFKTKTALALARISTTRVYPFETSFTQWPQYTRNASVVSM